MLFLALAVFLVSSLIFFLHGHNMRRSIARNIEVTTRDVALLCTLFLCMSASAFCSTYFMLVKLAVLARTT